MKNETERKREGFQFITSIARKACGISFEHWHFIALLLMIYDALALGLSYFIALWLRFDLRYSMIDTVYVEAWKNFLPFHVIFSLLVFWYLKLYKSIWRFASYSELLRVSIATFISAGFHIVGITLLHRRMRIS